MTKRYTVFTLCIIAVSGLLSAISQNLAYLSLIAAIFVPPILKFYFDKPRIKFTYKPELAHGDKLADYYNLLVILDNTGNNPLSFNRVQFVVPQNKISCPETGKTSYLWFNQPGENQTDFNWQSGCSIAKGTPITLTMRYKDVSKYLKYCQEKSKGDPIHFRIYYEGTGLEATSKNPLSQDDIKKLIEGQLKQNNQSTI